MEQDFDVLFKPEEFHQAFKIYNEMNNNDDIDIPNELQSYKLNENIQLAGVSDNGKFKYDIDGKVLYKIKILLVKLTVLSGGTRFLKFSSLLYVLVNKRTVNGKNSPFLKI